MFSGQGQTLQGVGLTKRGIAKTTGSFRGATTFECVAAGDLKFTWEDNTTDTVSFIIGDANPFQAKSVEIVSGTFHIGFD